MVLESIGSTGGKGGLITGAPWEKHYLFVVCVTGSGAVQAEQPGEAWPDAVLQDGR